MASSPDFQQGAYTLLSKAPKEIAPAEEEIIFADLRKRREAFLRGVQDKAPAKRAPAKSVEEKQAASALLMDDLLSMRLDGSSD